MKRCLQWSDIIKKELFYSHECEKVKINWFCYELSLYIYGNIKKSFGKKLKKYKIDEESLVDFCIFLSKEIKNIILKKLSGKIEKNNFSYTTFESYFQNPNNKSIFPILSSNKKIKFFYQTMNAVDKARDELFAICNNCPNRCVIQNNMYCTLFDDETYL